MLNIIYDENYLYFLPNCSLQDYSNSEKYLITVRKALGLVHGAQLISEPMTILLSKERLFMVIEQYNHDVIK